VNRAPRDGQQRQLERGKWELNVGSGRTTYDPLTHDRYWDAPTIISSARNSCLPALRPSVVCHPRHVVFISAQSYSSHTPAPPELPFTLFFVTVWKRRRATHASLLIVTLKQHLISVYSSRCGTTPLSGVFIPEGCSCCECECPECA
jgi:hypothetical protein